MVDFFAKNKKYFLAAILILAVFLIFFRLTLADIQTDDAIYSSRAISYIDYLDSDNTQTTPFNWFKIMPWWSKLSFHDAPPLVFLIQFLFFKLFGVSIFVARLPFALAGIGSVFLLYLLTKKLYNQNTALLASLILTISSYHVWASRVGYLESVALFFILLTLYLFLKALVDYKLVDPSQPNKLKGIGFIWFGVALGLTLLTKYTTFFVLPVIFFYILLKNKKIFFNKYFIYSIIIAVLFFSPVLIYNFQMYQARGHFDLQFASLLGQDMSDWPIISGSGISKNYISQAVSIWKQFASLYSLPMYLLIILSVIYFLVNFIGRIKQQKKNLFIVLILLFITIQFSLLGANVRFISLFNPFLALITALALVKSYQFLIKDGQLTKLKKIGYILVLLIIFGFELFYNLNTNSFLKPVGEVGKHYSSYRWENGGFNQLSDWLEKEANLDEAEKISVKGKNDIMIDLSTSLVNQDIFIYDPTLNWFSTHWYFRRWGIYYKKLFISAADLERAVPTKDWFSVFQKNGVKNMYYILGINELVSDFKSENKIISNNLAKIFEGLKSEEEKIYNLNNQSAFKIYKLKLN